MNQSKLSLIESSLKKLMDYIESERYKGYDPYDILNSFIPFNVFAKYTQALAIQIHKRNYINLRPMMGIRKEYNPKALGLILQAYSHLYGMKQDIRLKYKMEFVFTKLLEIASKNYNGYCWGYNFAWTNPAKVVPKNHPNIVVTSFAGKGIFEYYKATGDTKALEILNSIARYILEDIPISRNNCGICFSYSDILKDCCFNASLLAAEFLAMLYSLTSEDKYLSHAKLAVDFVLAYQKPDGRWNYSIDLNTMREDNQIDFHQGFIVEALRNIIFLCRIEEKSYIEALLKGADFYVRNQVVNGTRMKYRYPKEYPVDIHNQSQAIITFSELGVYDIKYIKCAEEILIWTIMNMQQPDKGYFYYRKGKHYVNKIPYIRWSESWMFLALAVYLKKSAKL